MTDIIENVGWPGWKTVRLIGRGSFGSVYEIQRYENGVTESAAVKVISIPRSEEELEEMYSDGYNHESLTVFYKQHLQGILDEYTIMKKMNGKTNIVCCDDIRYVQHDDKIGWDIFIKMEILTPFNRIKAQEFSEDEVIKLGIDLCTALEHCKEYNIVHRDIKPQNIFRADSGDYKLGDFGVAKIAEKTMGGTKIGSYEFMAPEVYNNKPYGCKADMYSLGLVLFWFLNERRTPFLPLPPEFPTPLGMDEAKKRRFNGEAIPEPVNGSDEIKEIVLKACDFNEKDRYENVSQMKEALIKLKEKREAKKRAEIDKPGESVSTAVEAPSKGKLQKKLLAIILSIVAVFLLFGIFFFGNSQLSKDAADFSGKLKKNGDVLSFDYEAEYTGTYYFFFGISDPLADYSFEVISGQTGLSRGINYYSDAGDYVAIDLTGGGKYTVNVGYRGKPCSFSINVKDGGCDVYLEGNKFSGSIDSHIETDVYHYTPVVSGTYKFTFDVMKNGDDYEIEIISETSGSEKVKRRFSEDSPEIELYLTETHSYMIKIYYCGYLCSYKVSIDGPLE